MYCFYLNYTPFFYTSSASRSILPATCTYVPTTLRQCFQQTQQSRSKGTGLFFSRTPHLRPVPSVRSNGKYTDRWILILIYTPSIGFYSLVLFSCTLSHSNSLPNPTSPISHTHSPFRACNHAYSSSLTRPFSAPAPPPLLLISGMAIILTTKLVQPVKCCVRCPSPVSGLYCSHANPVSFQELYTVLTRFCRKEVYSCEARTCEGPGWRARVCMRTKWNRGG